VKIALTNPFCWPKVRRGSERFISELARYLCFQGDEVVTLSSQDGMGADESSEGGRRIIRPFLKPRLWDRLRLTPAHTFFYHCWRTLPRLDVDLVHSLHHTDALAANLRRKGKRYKTVYQIMGVPMPDHFRRKYPPEHLIMQHAIQQADARLVLSSFTLEMVRNFYGCDAEVLPLPVDTDQFDPKPAPVSRPVLLASAAFDDRRKGLRVLVEAFRRMQHLVPGVVLQLSGAISDATRAEVIDTLPPETRTAIHVLGVGRLQDLPRLYREASVMVLPSMWEAQGMVILEALASGTPVACTRHGAFPEIISDPQTGAMFDPESDGFETANADGLANAILQGLALAEQPATIPACRRAAERYSWRTLGPRYQKLHRKVNAA